MNKDKTKSDSHARSLLKGITWRVLATTTTILIAFIITGDASSAFTIGGIEFFGKLLLYYLHERVWEYVPRGFFRINS